MINEFIALEPSKYFWTNSIGGKPTTYLKPQVLGNILLEDNSVDLEVCLEVFHHIPNVTDVLSELYRVLSAEGILILREPIFSMGDWRKKRKGLTKRERGIPLDWLKDRLRKTGFTILESKLCMVPITTRLAKLFGIKNAYNYPLMVIIDQVLSWGLSWNYVYHRKNFFQKLAPTSVFIVAKKL